MRAFEASEGEMIWLTSDGGWHPINPPVAPGWIIRVAELAIEDLIEEHEKRALAPQPEADPVREARTHIVALLDDLKCYNLTGSRAYADASRFLRALTGGQQ